MKLFIFSTIFTAIVANAAAAKTNVHDSLPVASEDFEVLPIKANGKPEVQVRYRVYPQSSLLYQGVHTKSHQLQEQAKWDSAGAATAFSFPPMTLRPIAPRPSSGAATDLKPAPAPAPALFASVRHKM